MTDTVIDPVCGMQINPDDAVASEKHDGRVFYFCSEPATRRSSPTHTATAIPKGTRRASRSGVGWLRSSLVSVSSRWGG